jgi:hypothetical protein
MLNLSNISGPPPAVNVAPAPSFRPGGDLGFGAFSCRVRAIVNVRYALPAAALAFVLTAGPALARPYLMLFADDTGFKALDLGGIDRTQEGQVEVTLIEAPLAGAPVNGKLAPLIERRVQVSCAEPQSRLVAITYADGQEKPMSQEPVSGGWRPFGQDPLGPEVQAAACQRKYRQQAVSRFLNLGEILANFQAAHARAKPEPIPEKDRLDRAYKNGR